MRVAALQREAAAACFDFGLRRSAGAGAAGAGGEAEAEAHRRRAPGRCGGRLLLLAAAAAAAQVAALFLRPISGVRPARPSHLQQQEHKCAVVRGFTTEWLKKQAATTHAVALSMTNEMGLPPRPDARTYDAVLETMRFTKTLHGGDSFATPSMAWAPTVAHADRKAYEADMRGALGYDVNITQMDDGCGQPLGPSRPAARPAPERPTYARPAPERPTYNPTTAIWSVLDGAAADPAVSKVVGDDGAYHLWQTSPAAASRVFEERRSAATPAYLASGEPVADVSLAVIVPYCGPAGCAAEGAAVIGTWTLGLEAELWGAIFPAYVEVIAFDGVTIKSVAKKNYNDYVVAHESQLELELRCHYKSRGIFHDAAPYLWLGAIGLIVFASAGLLVHVVDKRMRSNSAVRRHSRIIDMSPDAIVSLTLSPDGVQPEMKIVNPGGHHRFRGTTSTIELSDVVSACDVARVRNFLEDPTSSLSMAFESRFFDAASGRAIPYEVAVSPVVASKHPYGERICIFRDVLLRAQREEESLRAVEAQGRAEEHLNNELKTEKYLSHELKNRAIVLVDLCLRCTESHSAATPLPGSLRAKLATLSGLANELLETTIRKSVMLHLATGVYEAHFEDTDMPRLLATRLARLSESGRNVVLLPTGGAAAAYAASLLLDPLLVNIIADNLLSNAIKYGAAARPPSVAVRIEPVEDGIVSLSLVVRNFAGPDHARLLALGDGELNLIASTEGQRAHGAHGASSSAGDGFPMAVASAVSLGGTLHLGLTPTEAVATLWLPRVRLKKSFAVMDIPGLTTALVEDSALQRKMWARRISSAFTLSSPSILAGGSHASIESFAQTVVDADVDVVFVDQHFGSVHATKVGTDLVREIRAHDRSAGVPDRLIFVVSANDAPDDVAFYRAAGASGTLSKSISVQQLHARICQMAIAEPRFRGRVVRGAGPCP